MGTWDDTVLGSDAAMDQLGRLTRSVELDRDPAHLAVGIGLRLWLNPSELETEPADILAAIARHRDWLAALPPPTRAALEAIARDPVAASLAEGDRGAFDDALGAALGPRDPALLGAPDAAAVLDELVATLATELDAALAAAATLETLPRSLAALALLVQLAGLGHHPPAAAAAGWSARLDAIDRATTDEREHWDGYTANVRTALGAFA